MLIKQSFGCPGSKYQSGRGNLPESINGLWKLMPERSWAQKLDKESTEVLDDEQRDGG